MNRQARTAVWIVAGLVVGALARPSRAVDEGAPPSPREAWDAVYIGGAKIGFIHTKVRPVTADDGTEYVNVQVNSEVRVKRGDDVATYGTIYGTIEAPGGRVLKLDLRDRAGRTETRVSGTVRGDQMPLTIEAGGREQRRVLPWPDDILGPHGPELSLARDPMEPGEVREVTFFIPQLNTVGLTRMRALDFEEVTLGGGPRRLLRIEAVVTDRDGKPLPGMDTTYWADREGQILKSRIDAFGGMVTYRTNERAAKARGGRGFDIVEASIVKTATRINNARNTRDVTYRVRFRDGQPGEVFPRDPRQSLSAAADGSTLLRVRTDGPAGGASSAPVAREYTDANPMIDSEHPEVVALARGAVAGAGDDPRARAAAINRWVAENLSEKNFETAFATAADVARQRSGDCSEHSVLAAAMCRAAGIPSRVVVGLIYVDELGGFGYHMWIEAHVDGRWVPLDPTLGQSEVDATHLKLSTTSLDGIAPFEQFLDVVRVFDKLELEPIAVR